jgi:hypothetical protein
MDNLILLVLLVSAMLLLLMRLVVFATAMLLLRAAVTAAIMSRHISGSKRLSTLKVDKDAAGILLCAVPESQLATQLLNLGLNPLDMASRVVTLADNGMKMCLAMTLVGPDALLENALGFFDELAVEVYAVGLDAAGGIVGAEDEFRGLAVVVVHFGIVRLAFVGEFFCAGAVAVVVGLLRLRKGFPVSTSRNALL